MSWILYFFTDFARNPLVFWNKFTQMAKNLNYCRSWWPWPLSSPWIWYIYLPFNNTQEKTYWTSVRAPTQFVRTAPFVPLTSFVGRCLALINMDCSIWGASFHILDMHNIEVWFLFFASEKFCPFEGVFKFLMWTSSSQTSLNVAFRTLNPQLNTYLVLVKDPGGLKVLERYVKY